MFATTLIRPGAGAQTASTMAAYGAQMSRWAALTELVLMPPFRHCQMPAEFGSAVGKTAIPDASTWGMALGAAAARPLIDRVRADSVRRGAGLLVRRPVLRVMLSPVEQCA